MLIKSKRIRASSEMVLSLRLNLHVCFRSLPLHQEESITIMKMKTK